jgi:hypothetical protein
MAEPSGCIEIGSVAMPYLFITDDVTQKDIGIKRQYQKQDLFDGF